MEKLKIVIEQFVIIGKKLQPYIVMLFKWLKNTIKKIFSTIVSFIPNVLSLLQWILRKIKKIIHWIIFIFIILIIIGIGLLINSKMHGFSADNINFSENELQITIEEDKKNSFKSFSLFLESLKSRNSQGKVFSYELAIVDENRLGKLMKNSYIDGKIDKTNLELRQQIVNYAEDIGYVSQQIDNIDDSIDIILKFQNFLNYLYSFSYIDKQTYKYISDAQIKNIENFLEINSIKELSDPQKTRILISISQLEPQIFLRNTLIKDLENNKLKVEMIKREGLDNSETLHYNIGFQDIENEYLQKVQDFIIMKLFYSDKETKLLLEKIYYDLIQDEKSEILDSLPTNITVENLGNYMGKLIIDSITDVDDLFYKNLQVSEKKEELTTILKMK